MSKTNVFKAALAYARDSFLCERSDDRLAVRRGFQMRPLASPFGLPQHANQHRPERPVLLEVDQEFSEGG